ncbi:cytochrome c biogenesis protein CcmG/thiol:disulfide interchange protein DsbE [Litorimonas taeanensis]|uniref:Cytochrome c biogenesis protein CcmG/thiol:disulfide interchange protein DsbE n=1 Tax=Litorimonas taeanensis TaxID=568099 RepID=A0A420WIE3_9PROT|nr:DsbE family thiol:disulfide interchange protein [Litorimonas taeanensis]RKQ70801.1 cytochrome c biogenesis protein CcmG/thiol:disulfide interchange protein DsbE [Litorimonas taeanensis]
MRGLIPLIVFGVIAIALAIGLTNDPRRMEDMLIDQPFPEFSLPTLYEPETQHSKSDIQNQVSLINVFGSWCVTCIVEHPVLMNIAETETVRLIGHNWRDERDKAITWLARQGNPYDSIIFDPDSTLAISLGVTAAPETFITDKQGRIRYKHSGDITEKDWETVLKPLIESLQAE